MSIYLPANKNRDEWQLAVWNADDAVLTRPQKLVLMLMLEASFNSYDAFRVVGDLLRHRDLWEGVTMARGFPMGKTPNDRFPYLHSDLNELRDLPGGHWNVDTVYLMHRPEQTDALTRLAGTWSADEINNYPDNEACSLLGAYCKGVSSVLRVWWD